MNLYYTINEWSIKVRRIYVHGVNDDGGIDFLFEIDAINDDKGNPFYTDSEEISRYIREVLGEDSNEHEIQKLNK